MQHRHRRPSRTRRLAAALCALGLLGAVAQVTPAAPDRAPKIAFSQTRVDLGKVPSAGTAEHTFTVYNRGDADLIIEDATASCGCTLAKLEQRRVPPGGSTRIVASMDTVKYRGLLDKTITVKSNDPVRPEVILGIKVEVVGFIDLLPSSMAKFVVPAGERKDRTFKAKSNEEGNFAITKTESSLPHVAVKATPDPAVPNQYDVVISVLPDAPAGDLQGAVTLHTNSARQPTAIIQVRGEVMGSLRTTPRTVFFGALREDGTAPNGMRRNASINVDRRSGEPFRITKVDPGTDAITTQVNTRREGEAYSVILSYAGGFPLGPFEGTITIHTTSQQMPVLEVPYKGKIVRGGR